MAGDALTHAMSTADFLVWEDRQDTRHEFVDGVVRAMVGGTVRHERLVRNTLMALVRRLAGSPCEPFGSNLKVIAPNGNVRYPDVTVHCGRAGGDLGWIEDPTLIVEVLSPSNTPAELAKRLRDYAMIPTVRIVLLIEQRLRSVTVYRRRGDVLVIEPEDDLREEADVVALPEIGCDLPLADIYLGVDLPG